MTNRTMETQELQGRYGHLFDGILDKTQAEYRTQQELEREAQSRYGHLADYMKSDNTIYDNMIGIVNTCRHEKQRREEVRAQADIRMKERAEREKREKQEHIDRNDAFVNYLVEKDMAEKKARMEAEEQRRREAEKKQDISNSLRRMGSIMDEMSEKSACINAMLERDAQREKEYRDQMEWYRKQSRK